MDDFQFMISKQLYIGYKRLLRLLLGKKRRDEYIKKHGIGLRSFIKAERPIKANGIVAIPRKNTDDYGMLFMPRDEERLLDLHLQMNSNETFVDIGANVGYYTLKIATRYGIQATVVSIEADPENYKALCRNISYNGFKNVIAVNKAVTSDNGTITTTLYRHIDSKGSVVTSESSTKFDFGRASPIQVKSKTLDNILKELSIQADLIKMDIEGAEVEALKGSVVALNHSRKIIVEIHGSNLNAVKDILIQANYKISVVNVSGQDYVIADKIRIINNNSEANNITGS